jgi:hypothetical protein
MKKLRIMATSVIVLAIVCSALAFNAKKNWTFCYTDTFNGTGEVSPTGLQRVAVGTSHSVKYYYIPCWEGDACTTLNPTVASGFIND